MPGLVVLVNGLGLLYSKRSFLRKSGYIKSVSCKRPVRADGSPLPWMNYSIIMLLEGRLNRDLDLFEYGCGNSTLFYAGLVNSVTSVEDNREWYEYVEKTMPENVQVLFRDSGKGEDYTGSIHQQDKKYHVVIVDGTDRVNCMLQAPKSLSEDGVILLDDTQNGNVHEGIEYLRKLGFRSLDFEGLKPGGNRAYRTTLFYRDGNCFCI